MRKILFLEDRPERQKIFLPSKEKDVDELSNIDELIMPIADDCKKIISSINQEEYAIGNDISLVIIHKTSLSTQGLHYINSICEKNNIDLILFSGGIDQLIYNNEKNNVLEINSSDIYTNKLIPFINKYIQDENTNLLELVNSNWQISYWFLLRQLQQTIETEQKNAGIDDDRIIILKDKIEKTIKVLELDQDYHEININENIKKILIES